MNILGHTQPILYANTEVRKRHIYRPTTRVMVTVADERQNRKPTYGGEKKPVIALGMKWTGPT